MNITQNTKPLTRKVSTKNARNMNLEKQKVKKWENARYNVIALLENINIDLSFKKNEEKEKGKKTNLELK